MSSQPRITLSELARTFLKLGLISFGGPAAHLAMMEEDLVQRKKWITRESFLDLMGAVNLIPGPNSTEVAIHIGYQTCGFAGLLVAGICFILPAALIVTALAALYMHFGKLPEVIDALEGVRPVVVAIILHAFFFLGKSAFRTSFLAGTGIVAALMIYFGVNELAALFFGGVVSMLRENAGGKKLYAITPLALPAVAAPVPALGVFPLFLVFLKIGAVMFGSGYVLLAFLRGELVLRHGWLTDGQLFDAVVVGQATPGPFFTTATFIGYVLMGLPGAAVATVGIFLPAFFFVAISSPFIPRIRESKLAGAFLDGLNAASLGLMAVVTLQLLRMALSTGYGVTLFILAAVLLWKFRINTLWLVLGGVLAGLLNFIILHKILV